MQPPLSTPGACRRVGSHTPPGIARRGHAWSRAGKCREVQQGSFRNESCRVDGTARQGDVPANTSVEGLGLQIQAPEPFLVRVFTNWVRRANVVSVQAPIDVAHGGGSGHSTYSNPEFSAETPQPPACPGLRVCSTRTRHHTGGVATTTHPTSITSRAAYLARSSPSSRW